jgi:hypothetical protein
MFGDERTGDAAANFQNLHKGDKKQGHDHDEAAADA